MRTLTTAVLVLVLALPAMAQDSQVVEISHEHGSPQVTDRSGLQGPIRSDIVGSFLVIQYGYEIADSLADDRVSVNVSDPTITRAEIFTDGTVELTREAPEQEPQPQPQPETVDLVEEFQEIDWSQLLHLMKHPVF